jgi:hypothetical protein
MDDTKMVFLRNSEMGMTLRYLSYRSDILYSESL